MSQDSTGVAPSGGQYDCWVLPKTAAPTSKALPDNGSSLFSEVQPVIDYLSTLSAELLLKVIEYLPLSSDISAFSRSCKKFYDTFQEHKTYIIKKAIFENYQAAADLIFSFQVNENSVLQPTHITLRGGEEFFLDVIGDWSCLCLKRPLAGELIKL